MTRRPKRAREQLHGLHSVSEALRAGRRPLYRLLVEERGSGHAGRGDLRIEGILKAAAEAGVPVELVAAQTFRRDAGDANPQGVALEVGPLPELSLRELCESARLPRRFVALDGVEDPQNLGAIARVAEASGVQGLILGRRRAPSLTPAVARASAGAIEWLPVSRVSNLVRAIGELKALGLWVVGADLSAGETLYEVPDRILQGDLLIVLGAEGRGLRPSIRDVVDHPVRIPMLGRIESLNVASAAAVLLYELMRRSPSETRPVDRESS